MSSLEITKLDAGYNQLQTAITLFMKYGDPVSIHTLASASQEIFEALGKHINVKTLKLHILDMVLPERKDDFIKLYNKHKNFFKHGERDVNKTIKFDPDSTDFVIWDAILQHHYLTGKKIPLFVAFNLWMYAKYPKMFVITSEQEKIYKGLTEGFDYKNRQQFLDMVPIFEEAVQEN